MRMCLHLSHLAIALQIHPPLQKFLFTHVLSTNPSEITQLLIVACISVVPLLITHPLEVIKIRLQTRARALPQAHSPPAATYSPSASNSTSNAEPQNNQQLTNANPNDIREMWLVAYEIVRVDGVRQLWAGAFYRSVAYVIQFSFGTYCRRMLSDYVSSLWRK